ncbi:MAG TPA: OmpA family protein [Verrucomicrobiae bacterium]|jgi:outer membrane protein OmpA-like peptidoglycan-associated protein|nr:OmpA family protein [Verrucomicrobiae bacterium]
MKTRFAFVTLLLCSAAAAWGQTAATAAPAADQVSRTTKAVNYRRAGGSTKISFQGTELMPQSSGEARVESKSNRMEVNATFENMEQATKFGLEYLTYVLWAISSQGRAMNMGEIVLKDGKGHAKAITDMQTFGMVVTAEPYFAVTQPSSMVVLENVVSAETAGRMENIDAKFELIPRGAYSSSNTKIESAIFGIDRKTPMELFEARNAVRIAHIAQADKYAPSATAKAEQQLRSAEDAYRQGRDKKTVEAAAREVVQTAEDARVMAVQQKAEEDAHAKALADKKAAEEREAKARADAAAEIQRRLDAEQARKQAETAKADAERAKLEAEKATQEAERQKQEAQRQKQAAEQATALAMDQQKALAIEAEKARKAASEAERLRLEAEQEKQGLRAQLLQQLNSILATRDTARGLIANMGDVLFRSGSFELRPEARERLAKVSGIVLAHAGLHLEIEGHTDSVGTDDYNQQLSERRASAVRDYLVQQGISADSIVARGLGKGTPVASNDTAEGRQQNRRVEMVLSGDVIGVTTSAQK